MFAHYLTAPLDPVEKVWLVLWEAGLVIQIPLGVLFVYPSALLLHFNVRIEGRLRLPDYYPRRSSD